MTVLLSYNRIAKQFRGKPYVPQSPNDSLSGPVQKSLQTPSALSRAHMVQHRGQHPWTCCFSPGGSCGVRSGYQVLPDPEVLQHIKAHRLFLTPSVVEQCGGNWWLEYLSFLCACQHLPSEPSVPLPLSIQWAKRLLPDLRGVDPGPSNPHTPHFRDWFSNKHVTQARLRDLKILEKRLSLSLNILNVMWHKPLLDFPRTFLWRKLWVQLNLEDNSFSLLFYWEQWR